MYTNIDTSVALHAIATFLHQRSRKFKDTPIEALSSGLAIIMQNNIFKFGDTKWLQLKGTAMGTPPAPPYATLFFAIFENKLIPKFEPHLHFYRRYIDDVFGIWIPPLNVEDDTVLWNDFCLQLNNVSCLNWDISPRSCSVDFLDLTITLQNEHVNTTLFEKALNLYLYIPPHSAHPPGVLTGLVLGNCHRIYSLCSDKADIIAHIRKFFHRLTKRGYKRDALLPLFLKANLLAAERSTSTPLIVSPEDNTSSDTSRVFLHLPYHPSDPRSSTFQATWREKLLAPENKKTLPTIINNDGILIGANQMTVAYSRPLNLGNLLSPRNLDTQHGPAVSSYIGLEPRGA